MSFWNVMEICKKCVDPEVQYNNTEESVLYCIREYNNDFTLTLLFSNDLPHFLDVGFTAIIRYVH